MAKRWRSQTQTRSRDLEKRNKRNFSPGGICKSRVSDITYVKTKQGWLYLTIILDLFDRQVIGWSPSRKANCWDNAVAESFFKTLKTEWAYHQKYKTIEEAELSVFGYIEIWYNRKRLHSALG